ncbi:RNA polymerase sigma factor [Pendulispora brunnea]|uniref:RNA polymerase sigma factor n=1 Tax=Pendulispora brunnea TaxID=2905690 RepID=A0ABZ2K8Z3_9BACT
MPLSVTAPHLVDDPSFPPERREPQAAIHFDDVYAEHFAFVWRSTRRLGVSPSSLDDVVQEIFLVVHRKLGDYQHKGSIKTWLFGIVRRIVSQHRRTERRKPSHAGAKEATDLDVFHDPKSIPPDASAEQAQAMRVLDRLLDELDDDKREAFVLSELEEMTIAEISEAIDVNPNTVASRIRAARRAFEAALERFEQGEAQAPRSDRRRT